MEKMSETLRRLSRKKEANNVFLLLRHAEKQNNSKDFFGNEVGLTHNGEISAKKLGNKLQPYIGFVATSPLKRCVDTGKFLLINHRDSKVYTTNLLGDPGVFINNPSEAGKLFLKASPQEIANHLISTIQNPIGFCQSTSSAIYYLMNQLTIMIMHQSLISIFVTHDIILAVIVAFYFSEKNVNRVWPNYLEGLLIWNLAERFHLLYRNKEIIIPSREFLGMGKFST